MYTKKRRPNDRAYSKEYVQLLEEQQTALIKGVKELYRRNRSGEALPDLPNGCDEHMLIHEVLTSLNVLPKRNDSLDLDDHQHHGDSSIASSVGSPVPQQSYFSDHQVPVLSTSPSSPSDMTHSPPIPALTEFEGFMSTFDSEQIEGMQNLMQNIRKPTIENYQDIFAEPYLMNHDLMANQLPPNSEHFVNPRDTSFSMPFSMAHAYVS